VRTYDAMTTSVRHATLDDAAAIAQIYNQGIEDRIATFEVDPRSASDVAEALRLRSEKYPAVVAEDDGRIVAVAWTSGYRPRECYAGIAEFSVYTDRRFRGRGLGRIVMQALVAEAADRGFWKLVSRVFPENHASRALLEKLGFREVGVYRRHGRLEGEWRDCVILELLIGEGAEGMP
jgi:L-amino acid N-acyltransferase YncA